MSQPVAPFSNTNVIWATSRMATPLAQRMILTFVGGDGGVDVEVERVIGPSW
jgi:hypothetical protein